MDKITCVCPTFGRYTLLRKSLTYFLHQTWENKKLLIFNDAPVPIHCDFPSVEIYNAEERFDSLGYKRQAALEYAETDLLAHWDDDDVYLPWHLEMLMQNKKNYGCVKPNSAWVIKGAEYPYDIKGIESNVFEAMILFDRNQALNLGGYTTDVSGQTVRMMKRFKRDGNFRTFEPNPAPSLGFRWANGKYHIQGGGQDQHEEFAKRNRDFGDGEPLRPKQIKGIHSSLEKQGPQHLSNSTPFLRSLKTWNNRPTP